MELTKSTTFSQPKIKKGVSDTTNKDESKDESQLRNKSPLKKKEPSTKDTRDKSPIKKRKVVWAKNMVKITDVESFKKYNIENCHEDPNIVSKEKIKCSCIIF